MNGSHARSRRRQILCCALAAGIGCFVFHSSVDAAQKGPKKTGPAVSKTAPVTTSRVKVVDGLVQPRRPLADAVTDAIQFLRKGDDAYVPGNIEGVLAGYFMAALVNADGTRVVRRQLSFPARHHGYFIRTFLHYYAYTGEHEWLLRARDLADWNIATSTPASDAYGNLPYSSHQDGKPMGSGDRNSINTDKPAFLGTSYLMVYEATGDRKYLEAARRIGATLGSHQRPDGSWPFRVVPRDGTVVEDFGGAPVYFVQFFEALQRHDPRPNFAKARDAALKLMITRNVEQAKWGTYHEDTRARPPEHVSAEPMSFTAAFFFEHAGAHPEYLELGKRVLRQMETSLVHTEGHAASPAPGVAEQAGFELIMAGHTARYCMALSRLYAATGDAAVKRRAMSALNALTYMQSEAGLFRTEFYDTRKKEEKDAGSARNWYSQHLYTVCHMLECMGAFPGIAPVGQDHVVAYSVAPQAVRYAPGRISYATMLPARESVKLGFTPKSVQVGGRVLAKGGKPEGWTYDTAAQLLTLRHAAGEVVISR